MSARSTRLTLILLLVGAVVIAAIPLIGYRIYEAERFRLGAWSADGKVFTNKWAGVRFTLPDGLRVADDAEIAAITGSGLAVAANTFDEQAREAAQARVAYDFMATADGGFPSISLYYENLSQLPDMLNISETDYLQTLGDQLETVCAAQGVAFARRGIYNFPLVDRQSWYGEHYLLEDGLVRITYYARRKGMYMIGVSFAGPGAARDGRTEHPARAAWPVFDATALDAFDSVK